MPRKILLLFTFFIIKFFAYLYATQPYEYSTYLKHIQPLPLTGETLWTSPQYSVELIPGSSLEFSVFSPKNGYWNLNLQYIVLSSEVFPPEVSVEINNKLPFLEAESIPLIQYWQYDTFEYPKNRYGDEVVPSQNVLRNVISYTLEDSTKIYKYPLWFKLSKGLNNVKITLKSGRIKLVRISFTRPKRATTYLKSTNTQVNEAFIVVNAEKPYAKSDTSVNAASVRDISVKPYDTYKLLLNCFGGSNWAYPGQSVVYKFKIEKDGFYKIAFKYKQDFKPYVVVFRKIKLDGVVPFEDLNNVRFEYTPYWKIQNLKSVKDKSDMNFYFSKGEHYIEIEVNTSIYQDLLVGLKEIIDYINEIALKIKYITAGKANKIVEWEIRDYFTDIDKELQKLINKIKNYKKFIKAVNGVITSDYTSLQVAQIILERLAKNPNLIPNKLDTLIGSTGSVISEISNVYNSLRQMPLILDEIYIYQGKSLEKIVRPSFVSTFIEGTKRFFNSFRAMDLQNKMKNESNLRLLNIWVNRPRPYVDILQQLIDKDFTPRTKIYVKLSIMRDEQKLILANAAKKSPDIALGISNWIPFEMGIRGAALDLTRFPDFGKFINNFYPGSLIPYFYEEHCYGLPETLDFYVLFYRKDIMQYLNIPIPKTWEDVKLILPELQRNGMNFYIPLGGSTSFKAWMTTAPFIMQYHGKLFTKDGLKTAIDSPETLKALKEMTELFTMYGMPVQVANFFESFRKGEIPIGIGNLTNYIQLVIAAPELSGRWGIRPSPGVKYGNVIERWQTGSAQAVVIFNDTKYPVEAWEFVKWWLSKETQENFVNQVVSTYGIEYLFLPSNRYAIDNVPLKREDLLILKEQFQWLQEIPKMPASYVLEREISNVWNKVVLEGKVLRVAVDDAVNIVNKEFARKLEEFGYYKDGKPFKPFKIYTVDDILEFYKKK
ncbi:MAG: extracellular solute-binding protein [Fervidobacterium sp.]|nr:extracellular solute-binding protein [Fervidobacterium sp.]